MKLFCQLGLHWRMKLIQSLFIDVVSGQTVFEAVCPCGKHWMIDSVFGFPFFKVPMDKKDDR